MLFWLLLLILFIWAVFRLLLGRLDGDRPGRETALDILDERFASGQFGE